MNGCRDPSVIIIGAGVFGTSTAYHLSMTHSCPSRITVIDRSPYPPNHAASTDINKIVRADYTSRFYMDLAYEALQAWKTSPILQGSPTGQRFFHESGWVALSNEGNDLAERIRQNLRERGTDGTSDIDIDQHIREKWDGILRETNFEDPQIEKGYWNPEAGWADAGDAVAKMMEAAVEKGVKYETGDVDLLMLGYNRIRGVRTKDGRVFEADSVLLATGAWTSQLLSPIEDELKYEKEDKIESQVTAAGVCVVHYKLSEDEYERLKDMPVIYGDRGEVLPPPRSSRLLKFTNARSFTNTVETTSGHKISIPLAGPQTTVTEKLQNETLSYIVAKTMPSFLSRTPDYWRLCWDGITPSQDQLITRHPDPKLGNLYLAVGGSFHSWKFLPTIGRYVVNMLDGLSNGDEKDRRWGWKKGPQEGRGAHEKVVPRREYESLS